MTRILRVVALSAMTTSLALGASLGASGAPLPIRPHQHFIGLVNNSHTTARVITACAGPSSSHRLTAVTGRQTVTVIAQDKGGGYTGPYPVVYAWFVPATHGARPVVLTFRQYGVAQNIPSAVRVPCNGTGTVDFSPCAYLAPCAFGWTPYIVKVRFVNIAA